MRATETGVEWACWALLLLAAGWAGAGAWDAVANGAQPRVFWSPLANASRACPAYGALGADGAVRCVEVCPEGPPLGRFCPAHGALARSWLGAWALEDDALGAAAAQLLHGAVVGVGVALGFNAVLAACAPLVIFGAGYGAAGALGLLGATLLADADPDAPASRRFAAWACLGAAALGAAVLAALHGALTAAASVVQRAAGGGAGCVATAAIVVPLCAAAQVAALAGGLYAAAAVLAADATVTPVPWTLVGREVRLGDRAAGDRAAAALAVGLWGAALARHAALLAFAAPAARRAAARAGRAAPPGLGAGAASLAATAAVAAAAWCALVGVRYAARRTETLRAEGRRAARPLLRVCECLASACAASLYVAFPMVYAAVALFGVGAWSGARRVGALASSHPVLFAVSAAAVRLIEALRVALAAVVSVASAVTLAEVRDPRPLALGALAAAVAAHAVTAPTAAAVNVGVLEHASSLARAEARALLAEGAGERAALKTGTRDGGCGAPSSPAAAAASEAAAGAERRT